MTDASINTTNTKKKKKGLFKSLAKGMSIKKKKKNKDDASVVSVSLQGGTGRSPPNVSSRNTPGPVGGVPSSSAGTARPPKNATRSATAPSSAAVAKSDGTTQSNSFDNNGNSGFVNSPAKPIQVILLLMDPNTRRFELLQLEFDSQKALVSDVLRQIHTSATEKSLREMTYGGVCDVEGKEMIGGERLKQFCAGEDNAGNSSSAGAVEVVMAMPGGMTGAATANLARPILGDPKVVEMLRPCGVDLTNILNRSSTNRSSDGVHENKSNKQLTTSRDGRNEDVSASSPSSNNKSKHIVLNKYLPIISLSVIIAILFVYAANRHIQVTRPIVSGDVLLPGEWKSQCGLLELMPLKLQQIIQSSSAFGERVKSKCDGTKSSMLEMGTDGTLRYFTKSSCGDTLTGKEVWSVPGRKLGCDGNAGGDHCAAQEGASFLKEGESWYVVIDHSQTSMDRDVIRDFM